MLFPASARYTSASLPLAIMKSILVTIPFEKSLPSLNMVLLSNIPSSIFSCSLSRCSSLLGCFFLLLIVIHYLFLINLYQCSTFYGRQADSEDNRGQQGAEP